MWAPFGPHCPWHSCRYDARTGKRQDAEGKLPVLPVAVQDGEIKVAMGVEEVAPQ
jgi:nitrite reductase/ring-hydroxylating ferredoxin subunit